MYQVGYVKEEAEPYILFENPTPQKKDKGWDFVKKKISHTLMREIGTKRTRIS
jgi:hypothetical protein